LSSTLFQLLHLVILVGLLAWIGYVLVKLIGPMLQADGAPREPLNLGLIVSWGLILLGLILLDQYLLGRFR
jgi:hypothetical protein